MHILTKIGNFNIHSFIFWPNYGTYLISTLIVNNIKLFNPYLLQAECVSNSDVYKVCGIGNCICKGYI
jgi:hypothetical protein